MKLLNFNGVAVTRLLETLRDRCGFTKLAVFQRSAARVYISAQYAARHNTWGTLAGQPAVQDLCASQAGMYELSAEWALHMVKETTKQGMRCSVRYCTVYVLIIILDRTATYCLRVICGTTR